MARPEAFHRTARRRRLLAVVATLAWLAVAPGAAGAATIRVTTARDEPKGSATCSLREAIQAAHENDAVRGCPAGERDAVDTIELPFSVELTITGPREDANATGDLDVDAGASGPVRIAGTGAGLSTITQTTADRVLELVAGSLTLERIAVTGGRPTGPNVHGSGGAVLAHADGALTVARSLIHGNVADSGGGISNGSPKTGDTGGTVLVTSSTVSGNRSAQYGGGGIQNRDGSLTAINSTVSGNTSAGRGGGLHNVRVAGADVAGVTTIVSSTITANAASAAGGNLHNSGDIALLLRSAIVSDPRRGGNCATAGNGLIRMASLGYNLADDAEYCNMTAPTDQPDTEPRLGPLADNGGPVPTHALPPASPAVDRGTSDTALAGIGPLRSGQRGLPRPVDFAVLANAPGGDGADVGAFELQRLPAAGPPAPGAERPSNRFRIVKVRKKRRRGIAVVVVRVPGPGRLALQRNRRVRPASKHPRRARTVRLKVRPRGKAKRTLAARRGAGRARVRVRARITYTPVGGDPRTRTRKLRLVRRR